MREAVRLELPGFTGSSDLIFHPRRCVLTTGFERLREEVRRVFQKCRI
jgi:hypothetical protein